MIHTIAVGVALFRPPMIDEFRRYEIEAEDDREAQLIACQMATHSCVMPVWSGWPDDVPFLPDYWIRGGTY